VRKAIKSPNVKKFFLFLDHWQVCKVLILIAVFSIYHKDAHSSGSSNGKIKLVKPTNLPKNILFAVKCILPGKAGEKCYPTWKILSFLSRLWTKRENWTWTIFWIDQALECNEYLWKNLSSFAVNWTISKTEGR